MAQCEQPIEVYRAILFLRIGPASCAIESPFKSDIDHGYQCL